MADENSKTIPGVVKAAGRTVDVIPSSQLVGEGDQRRWVPTVVKVSQESELTRDLQLVGKGPFKKDGVNTYITIDGKKLRFDGKTGALLSLLLAAALALFTLPLPAFAQFGMGRTRLNIKATQAPYVTLDGVTGFAPATLLKVNFTSGNLYLGDTPVSVAAGQVIGLTASKTDCAGPTYTACDIVYANSSGTVAFTTAIATATASGNSVLAYVQTSSTAVTEIRYPWETTLGDPAVSTASTIFASATNCASSAGTCAAAPAGGVTIAAAATTVTVATTAVSANSEIFVFEDSSLGTRLSVTCNTVTGRIYSATTRTAGTSFVITSSAAPATNPACLNYLIVN